jgi:hypothetical protein
MTEHLSTTEKEWIEMTAKELAFKVTEEVLNTHVKTCPWGQKMTKFIFFWSGICVACSLIGSVIWGLITLLSKE